MATSQQPWPQGSLFLLLVTSLALVLLAGSAEAQGSCPAAYRRNCYPGPPVYDTCVWNNTNHCGRCHYKCPVTPVYPHAIIKCVGVKCVPVCIYGWGNCDNRWSNGCEKYLLTDVNNCGLCGHKCPPPYLNGISYCDGGVCKVKCKPGHVYDPVRRYCVPL